MAFRYTQLGRFGELSFSHFGAHADPDLKAAHALAVNGVSSSPPRPDLSAVFANKFLADTSDPLWASWTILFKNLVSKYQAITGPGKGSLLVGECTKTWPAMPVGFCMHELTPPLRYWSMRSFAISTATYKDNVIPRSHTVDKSVQPLWNYVLTQRGEILIAAEDFNWIKHTSIAGGEAVWAAGQVGIHHDKLFSVDLQSGHYIWPSILPASTRATSLINFTEEVFKEYFRFFGLTRMDPSFACIWA